MKDPERKNEEAFDAAAPRYDADCICKHYFVAVFLALTHVS